MLAGPYISRNHRPLPGLGLKPRSGSGSNDMIDGVYSPDGVLPCLAPRDSSAAAMADVRAPGDFRRHRAQSLLKPYLDAWSGSES